ncbi:MAG: hypothetical protein ACD_71C00188G0002 [uncultured bacterium (gcode 4)]|uniref:Alpha-L-glutamate ligase-related protein ATP-grasp domain-containing protein n=1 Tax=uncultured bacterium (gcode 4) TaxID=1234023 RepID=K1ZIM1_9BACT|nr:MAG: hypothetical protein ACD_71C00188G0002 [uncultured bacterium (gcode 4)]
MKFFSHGILGMNARNLRYIRTKNSADAISLADSKLKTKNFLSTRWIPFAETYATLWSQQELNDFSFGSIKSNSFVIKPNKWSQWKWILIVKKNKETYEIQDEEWTEDEIRLHLIDILHGSFSLHGSSDTVVIEELLSPWIDFVQYCDHGLADIRIIVYNYVPITAMVRMPTVHSGGKANLAQWWIWLGINIANGEIISLFQNKVIHTDVFPTKYEWLKERVIPFWDDILLFSSQVQAYTKLGYLALDWVITKNGPKLLEINARAGLEIQNVNLVPLASRLRKIEGIKILTPEKWVEIAKTLFQTETLPSFIDKKVLYLKQGWFVEEKKIAISIDMTRKESLVSKDVADLMWDWTIYILTDSHVSILLRKYEISSSCGQVILWLDDIKEYLINPNPFVLQNKTEDLQKWTQELRDFDDAVYKVGKKINLSSLLKPDNYSSLLDSFIRNPHGYNPIFVYHFPSNEKIESIRNTLSELTEKSHQFEQQEALLAKLYREKLTEIESKLWLVEAYKNENFEKIEQFNTELFGHTDRGLLKIAREKVFEMKGNEKNDKVVLGKILSLDEVVAHIRRYFETHNIKEIPITIESGNLSRMSVSYGRNVKIHISKNAVIRENEINAILAHEIDTHFRRYLAGSETGLKLFQYGTGYYLSNEEGLAIYRSFLHLPEGYEKNAMYVKYYLLSTVDVLSFSDTVGLLISLYPEKSLESIFSDAVRLKRGITYSWVKGISWITYQKDKIYLDGYTRIKDWIENGGDQKKLFYGKIKIKDIEIINQF